MRSAAALITPKKWQAQKQAAQKCRRTEKRLSIRRPESLIFTQISCCVFPCGLMSAPVHHSQCGRSAANPGGYDTHGVLPNSQTGRDLCSFLGAVCPLQEQKPHPLTDGIFCFPHDFRSANSSSRSVYPFTDGSFAILSASNMAAIVSLLG